MIPSKFTYSHKSNEDFVFTSDKGRLVFNPNQQHVCYYDGKQFIYYEAKEKEGMLERTNAPARSNKDTKMCPIRTHHARGDTKYFKL